MQTPAAVPSSTPARAACPVALSALLLAGLALGATGCGFSYVKAPDNSAIFDKLEQEYTKSPVPFQRGMEEPVPIRIAMAPIRYRIAKPLSIEAEEGAGPADAGVESEIEGEGEAAPAEGEAVPAEGGSAPAETGGEPATETGYYRAPAATEQELALRFRKPLRRQLLFAPIDPELAGRAPEVRHEPRRAEGEQGVVYVCPRCQNDVGADDEHCPHCGLLFAPEPAPGAAPAELATGEPAPLTEVVPPEEERHVCYFCGETVDPTDTACPHCGVSFLTPLEDLGPEGERPGVDVEFGQFRYYDRAAVYKPDADRLQEQLVEVLKQYGAFEDIFPMKELDYAEDVDYLVDSAWAQGYDIVLLPTVRRCEVEYRGINIWWLPSIALWAGAWVPSLWFPGEDWAVTLQLDIELRYTRNNQVSKLWSTRYSATELAQINQVDRGWYPWSILGLPLNVLALDGGKRDVFNGLYEAALAEVKEKLLREVYEKFVVQPMPIPPPQKKRNVVLLIGCDRVPDVPALLEFTGNDLELVDTVFREVSEFVKQSGKRSRTDGEIVRFDNFQEGERRATLANVRAWFDEELPKLANIDNFIFYFTGFGAAAPADDPNLWGDGYEKYLCLADTTAKDLRGTALSMTELKRALDTAACTNALVVLDTSFARQPDYAVPGITCKTLRTIDIQEPLDRAFLDELAKRGRNRRCAVIAASDIEAAAYETEYANSNNGASVLTDVFVQGVRGQADVVSGDGNGTVRVDEVANYAIEGCRTAGANLGVDIEVQVTGRPAQLSIILKQGDSGEEPGEGE